MDANTVSAGADGRELAETAYGSLLVDTSTAAGFSLVRYGQWQQGLIDSLTPLLKPDARVVDLAARTGYFATAMANHVVDGSMVVRSGGTDSRTLNPDNLAVVTGDLPRAQYDLIRVDARDMPAMSDLLHAGSIVVAEITTVDDALAVLAGIDRKSSRFLLRTPMFQTDNFRGNPTNHFGHGHQSWLLLLPPDQPAAVSGTATAIPCPTVHDMAQAILETPRFGDASPDDRDPAALMTSLGRVRTELEEALAQIEVLRDELGRAAYRESMLEKRVIRLNAHKDALQTQLVRLEVLEEAHEHAVDELATAWEILNGVQQSRSWQVTAPFRGFNERRRARKDNPR